MPQWRVLKCVRCTRLTDLQELAKRETPTLNGRSNPNLGCSYCGETSFEVKLIGSDTPNAPKRGGE